MKIDDAKLKYNNKQHKQEDVNSRASIYTEKFKGEYYNIPVEKLMPFQNQARRHFDQDSIESLASTIKEHGIRQPLTVIPAEHAIGHYEVVSGERRLRAAKFLGHKTVPCIIIHDRKKAEEVAIIENIQRKDLHPVELADAYYHLINSGICLSTQEVAVKLGIHKSSVVETMAVKELDEKVKQRLLEDQIKTRALLRLLCKLEKNKQLAALEQFISEQKDMQQKKVSKKRSISTKSQILNIVLENNELVVNVDKVSSLPVDLKANMIHMLEKIADRF